MAIYFIDGDNNPKEHIKGIELLAAGDEVHIFYAAKNTYYLSDKNRKAIMSMTEAGVFYKKVMSAPNSVDFAISIAAAERIGSRDCKTIFLVSSDKHFDTIASLLKEKVHEIISKQNCLLDNFFEGPLKLKVDKKVLAIYII